MGKRYKVECPGCKRPGIFTTSEAGLEEVITCQKCGYRGPASAYVKKVFRKARTIRKGSITSRVLHVLQNHPGERYDRNAVLHALSLDDSKKANVSTSLNELYEQGRLKRVDRGVYSFPIKSQG